MEIGRLNSNTSNWLFSKWIDLGLLFLPLWGVWLVFFSYSSYFELITLPVWAWVIFIVGLDVSHVWSSLFRTYFVKDEFNAHKKLFILAPIIALSVSIALLSISMLMFWRVMAYFAVFHFIKQQYGFVALYKLRKQEKRKQFIKDKLVIYIATIYPVIFWHFNSSSDFNWFVESDFLPVYDWVQNNALIAKSFYLLNWGYWLFIGAWFIQEMVAFKQSKISMGKVIWILTTAINWWFAIVYFNSDVIFSVSNVVAHGIPYLVLIYFYGVKKEEIKESKKTKIIWRFKWILLLICTVLIAAFVEEYFWDMLVYREHTTLFESVLPYHWDQLSSNWGVMLAVAILAMPQQVHYIIDGFIWKMNTKNPYLKPIFKPSDES